MQQLKIYQSLWGMEQRAPGKDEPSFEYNFEKAKNAGYHGLCLDLSVDEIDDFQEANALYAKFNLECMINAFPMQSSDMQPLMQMAKSLNAPLINIISGVMPLKPNEAVSCVKRWMKEAVEIDVNILFENVNKIWKRHQNGFNNNKQLWNILMLQSWLDQQND